VHHSSHLESLVNFDSFEKEKPIAFFSTSAIIHKDNKTLTMSTTAVSITTEKVTQYVTIQPLTTTFTPPASCGGKHLSQMSSPGYYIWLDEPNPVPNTIVGGCYPPEFIDGYTSIYNASSSVAVYFSPLVCPQGWHTATRATNGYIACCASYVYFPSLEKHCMPFILLSATIMVDCHCYKADGPL
jgi:hypothetical protein